MLKMHSFRSGSVVNLDKVADGIFFLGNDFVSYMYTLTTINMTSKLKHIKYSKIANRSILMN